MCYFACYFFVSGFFEAILDKELETCQETEDEVPEFVEKVNSYIDPMYKNQQNKRF